MKSIAKEDYLKNIYKINQNNEVATTSSLAKRLNIKAASVTSMVQKLATASPPLLNYTKHQGVTLTDEGEKLALRVIRRHRIIELFLVEKLNYSWDEVHEEAELLEHAMSAKLIERLSISLGHPTYDPHGQIIPNHALELVDNTAVPLNQLQTGETAVIHHVKDHDSAFLRYIDKIGMRPNTHITIIDMQPIDKLHHIQIKTQTEPLILGERVTENIFVEKTNAQE